MPFDNARQIYSLARHPKWFVALDGADSLLCNRSDADYIAIVLSTWASCCVRAAPALDPPPICGHPVQSLSVRRSSRSPPADETALGQGDWLTQAFGCRFPVRDRRCRFLLDNHTGSGAVSS